jgi:integrase
MAQIVFYLKSEKPDKHKKVSLLAQITSDYKPYRMKLGKVRVKDWNKSKQRLNYPSTLSEKEYQENLEINNLINNIETKARALFNSAIEEKRKLTESEIKNLLNVPEEPVIKKNYSFFEVFSEFIESNKPDKAERTIKGYTTVKNYIYNFQEHTRYYITWDNIDVTLVDKLKKYTFVTQKKQAGYYAKITRVLSTFLHWAEERNYYKGNIYDKLKAEEPEKEVIFLHLDELMTLMNYDFKNPRLNKVRDLYCFASFTGLRYSDVISLRNEHIKGRMLTKTQKKTGQVNTIPLSDLALEILNRNKGNEKPLPGMAIQNLNEYIKECCAKIAAEQSSLAGFNRLVIKKMVIGSEVTEEALPLHKAITFHTARKTFITNSIMLGINIKALQDMGAPKREKDLRKYLKITDAFKTEVMNETWNKLPLHTINSK